ncbi:MULTISPECIES: alpha/beta fold hydrolase [unclassified Bacillus (in: firmicutes)]|uniref:alpha/beta fold hydrolase n=1 Tax=unclassified Bacillus (in: firmicutes) TaxID=185979 RepID=UPI0008EA0E78|nr:MULTISPECIES: alpha/beta hydrolase [unclassified Bacillus (in: firmicutes)]SFA71765.1 Pimeloyl-ACP methyl ester carboxylesterase [Bacillus sp. UNCCL13]SFQ62064.1 Pimeloyl-ACP methyl ester carboxylesterase [Bacillus sp. cl95]
MAIKNEWISNKGTYIHFIDNNDLKTNEELPFIIVPGLSESAEDYIPLMKLLSPRRCIAITLRGRGHSDSPQEGYMLEDHISDIESVITYLKLDEFALMGFSRGVSYTLGYAFTNLKSIKGLVLGDYPAIHSQLPEGWVEYFSTLPPWRGKALSDRMKVHSLYGLQKESEQILFWDKLNSIHCPVLVIRGGKEGSALSEDHARKYLEEIPDAKLVVFQDSAHNIFEPDMSKVVDTLQQFLKSLNRKVY